MKFLLTTSYPPSTICLEWSYSKALEELGHTVYMFKKYEHRAQLSYKDYILARASDTFTSGIEQGKFSAALIRSAIKEKVDVVFLFCRDNVNAGTIGFLQSIGIKVIYYWPDPMDKLDQNLIPNFRFIDHVFTYSKQSIPFFNKLGSSSCHFLPFAGDLNHHKIAPPTSATHTFKYDITFLGNYRPEREEAILFILKNFPNLKVKVVGSWGGVQNKQVKAVVDMNNIYGRAYAAFFNDSYINLNVVDVGNLPAVNMRFFEIPTAGGLQICSLSEDMTADFIHQKHVMYYNDMADMGTQIEYAMSHKSEMNDIRCAAHQHILSSHTYEHRLQTIIDKF